MRRTNLAGVSSGPGRNTIVEATSAHALSSGKHFRLRRCVEKLMMSAMGVLLLFEPCRPLADTVHYSRVVKAAEPATNLG